jgi:hypothetical protein
LFTIYEAIDTLKAVNIWSQDYVSHIKLRDLNGCVIIIIMSLVTGLFFLVILLNQQWSQPLRLQASHCNTFRIMCDIPSIAVFCSESIECFPGTASKFYLKLLVTIIIIIIIIIIKMIKFDSE